MGRSWGFHGGFHGSKPWYLVNPKIAGIYGCSFPLKLVLIGIDPYPYVIFLKS